MRRRAVIAIAALASTLALGSTSFAAEIRKGAAMQVKPDSIWFEDAPKLTKWQTLKKKGDAAALTSYQEKMLSEREAWQFLNPLDVKVLSYMRRKKQVEVEMKTPGRFLGTTWFIDAGALGR